LAKKDLTSPEYYLNRELSWLEFNDRVLQEGLSEDLPPLERLKFLAIVGSNLDEFFLVRVAGLMQQRAADVRTRDPAGMTPAEQIDAVAQRAHRMVAEQTEGIRRVLAQLAEHGLRVLPPQDWPDAYRSYLQSYFTREILPILTPLAIQRLEPAPLLPSLQLQVAAVIETRQSDVAQEQIVVVPVPNQVPRFVARSSEEGLLLARLEDVIAEHLGALFPGKYWKTRPVICSRRSKTRCFSAGAGRPCGWRSRPVPTRD